MLGENEKIPVFVDNSAKYRNALEEIRNYILDSSDFDKSDSLQSTTGAYDILKIVDEVLKDA